MTVGSGLPVALHTSETLWPSFTIIGVVDITLYIDAGTETNTFIVICTRVSNSLVSFKMFTHSLIYVNNIVGYMYIALLEGDVNLVTLDYEMIFPRMLSIYVTRLGYLNK